MSDESMMSKDYKAGYEYGLRQGRKDVLRDVYDYAADFEVEILSAIDAGKNNPVEVAIESWVDSQDERFGLNVFDDPSYFDA